MVILTLTLMLFLYLLDWIRWNFGHFVLLVGIAFLGKGIDAVLDLGVYIDDVWARFLIDTFLAIGILYGVLYRLETKRK